MMDVQKQRNVLGAIYCRRVSQTNPIQTYSDT
jgi:hypothetical protein